MILVPSFMGYAEEAQKATLRANTRNVWTAAKASEAKAIYTKKIKVESYGQKISNSFKKEIEGTLGDSFVDKTSVTVEKSKIILVQYYTKINNKPKTCAFDGIEFRGPYCT